MNITDVFIDDFITDSSPQPSQSITISSFGGAGGAGGADSGTRSRGTTQMRRILGDAPIPSGFDGFSHLSHYNDVTHSRLAESLPNISVEFVTLIGNIDTSLSTNDILQSNKNHNNQRTHYDDINTVRNIVLQSDDHVFNVGPLLQKYGWLKNLISQKKSGVSGVTIDRSGVPRDSPHERLNTLAKFEVMMKERQYENTPFVKTNTSVDELLISKTDLLVLIDDFERQEKLLAGGSDITETISRISSELTDAQKKCQEYQSQIDTFKKTRDEAIATAEKITKFSETCHKVFGVDREIIKTKKTDGKVDESECGKIETKLVETMKDYLAQLLQTIDCEKIGDINNKLNETKNYVKHLLSVLAAISNADKIVKKFNNELPISSANGVPTCGICMAVPIDSSLTCGHLGCETCLIQCNGVCAFCKRSAGIIKLFI